MCMLNVFTVYKAQACQSVLCVLKVFTIYKVSEPFTIVQWTSVSYSNYKIINLPYICSRAASNTLT